MMKKIFLFLIFAFLVFAKKSGAQEIIKLTLDEAIELAEVQSPNALMAKHTFRASYWQYRTFQARYRPSLSLSGTAPDYSTAYDKVWNSQFERWDYKASNTISNNAALSLTQNIGLTGGSISLVSDLTMFNDLENDTRRFITSPVSILTSLCLNTTILNGRKKLSLSNMKWPEDLFSPIWSRFTNRLSAISFPWLRHR